jgi:HK97 family phage portal protein
MIKSEHRILWLPGEERSWDEGGSRSAAGVRIDASNALQVAAVFSCLRILGETVAGLPLHVLERLPEGGKRQARELPLYRKLHQQPNAWQTSFEWREQAVFHVGLWGNAFSELKPGPSGAVDQIVPLHPSRMKVERVENGRLRYKYREEKGQETIYSEEQILHIRGPSDDGVNGMSIVEECKDAIALARACELHGARFFAAGARPGFILSTDGQLNAEARETLASQWDRKHGGVANSQKTAVLTGGLKPYELPQSSNTDAQFLEARKYQLEEIGRLFRIPGSLLGIAGAGGNPEHSGLEFVQHTILPWLRRFESAFMRDLIEQDDIYEVEFDVRGLLRGDSASRSSYYRAMWDIGALSTNDILNLENRNPVEGGDVRYRPLNMGTLGEQPTEGDVMAQQQPGSEIDGQAVEGGLAAAAGEVVPAVPEAPAEPAETSLSTAEVSSLLTVVKQITDGMLTVDAARAIIAAAFPVLSAARVETILQGVAVKQEEPPQAPAAPAAAAAAAPAARSDAGESRDCGANDTGGGGFQPGNSCGKGAGGVGGSSSGGGSSKGGGSAPGGLKAPSKKHNVKLPKTKSRVTTDQAKQALDELGYKLGKTQAKKVGKGWVTVSEVTDDTGHTATLTTDEVKDLVYKNKRSADTTNDGSPAEARAMTISIDFDRTFAADPQLWGEFATKSVADGNTVVMISRRPEEDRATVMETLGDYADAFSQVLLVGSDTMKGDAAQAAGIEVDVWVDDSPQYIRSEQRAGPGTVAEGDFVSWDSSGGRARGRVDHVMDYGTLDIPGTEFKIEASKEDPAALITVYEEVAGGWRATETQVGHKVATLTKIDPLPEPPVEEKAYGKPKRKPNKRKRGGQP